MKIAVLGAGISGLATAYLLSRKYEVDLYEKEDRLGGHARTTIVEDEEKTFGVDTGFLVFNHPTYPLLTQLFKELHVKIEKSDMSFGFWDQKSNTAYNGQSIRGLFFQKKNIFSFAHYRMIYDIVRFNKKANRDLERGSDELDKSLGDYLEGFSRVFKERYLLPMGAAIWSTPSNRIHDFPARTFVQFFKNHGLLGVKTHHQWLTVSGGSKNYVEKIVPHISGKIIKTSDVISVRRDTSGVTLIHNDGRHSQYDKVVMAMHAPEALDILEDPTEKEKAILSRFQYQENEALLHNDTNVLYPDRRIYAAWNYKSINGSGNVVLSYWINRLQNLKSKKDYFVSLNESAPITQVIEKINYAHPQFDAEAIAAQQRHHEINGMKNTFYAGAYWRYGFHEDGIHSANKIATILDCQL